MILRTLLQLPRGPRLVFLSLLDASAVMVSLWAAFALRLGSLWPDMLSQVVWLFPVSVIATLPVLHALGFYRSLIRYAGSELLNTVVKGISIALLLMMASWVLVYGDVVPRTSWFIFWFVAICLIGGSRLVGRNFLHWRLLASTNRQAVAIYGAGAAGVQLAMALKHSAEFEPLLYVDDDRDLQGSVLNGLRVYPPKRLAKLIRKREIDAVLLALPSVPASRRRELLDRLAPLPVRVLAMPGLAELATGVRRIDELREVGVEEILGRDPVDPHRSLLESCIRGRSVMVTGAGGSIGSELCRQIVQHAPIRLVLFEHSEYALYAIEQELGGWLKLNGQDTELLAVLGSVTDRPRIEAVMRAFAVRTVYHAAAYKHVPIVEHNPLEGIRNNTFGTLHTALAARAAGVETFVLISTDKAVRPTNVMGATKRCAELVLQALARDGGAPRFCMVRFGNVLASSGSVVPLFREQIRRGGPVTVTHPDIVRYFMTIPEAAQLVIQAGAMGQGGDVFVLDMGEPVRIHDLAVRMIRLSGLEVRDEVHPEGDVEIVFSGLRPGEKLYEELLIGEHDQPTVHPKIRRAQEEWLPWSQLQVLLDELAVALEAADVALARSLLMSLVSGYRPDTAICDHVWKTASGLHTLPESAIEN